MKLFTFDDAEFELAERNPFDLFQCDMENDTEIIEWRGTLERPICFVEINGRFRGFTLWAKNKEEATKLLREQPEYVEWTRED